jgi:hypothetical protein
LGNSAPLLNVAPQVGIPSRITVPRQSSGTNAVEVPNNIHLNSNINRSEQFHVKTQSQTPAHANNAATPTPNIAPERSVVRDRGSAANHIKSSSRSNPAEAPRVETPTTPSNLGHMVKVPNSNVASGHISLPEHATLPTTKEATHHRDLSNNASLPTVNNAAQPRSSTSPTRVETLRRTHDGNLRFGSLPASASTPHVQTVGHGSGHQVVKTTERLKAGHLEHLVNSDVARQVNLKKQFQLHEHGDLARRLKLSDELKRHGGWHERLAGPISPVYTKRAFGHFYAGPGYYPHYCWFPHWSPWVNWCWNFTCGPSFDPRPVFCQPIVYDPCQPWTGWDYPVWSGLPRPQARSLTSRT